MNMNKKILDMGCGMAKIPSAVGVDMNRLPGVDVQWDLDKFPYPLEDNSFDTVYFRHSLEHLSNPEKAIEEAHRVLKNGGHVEVFTPHFSSLNAFSDLSHKHYFSLKVFDSYCGLRGSYSGNEPKFALIKRELSFWKLHDSLPVIPCKLLGIQFISRKFPTFYERFLPFIFPAMEMHIVLEAKK
ncbi:MAG: class I SAM-dependent methyltransferase [Elusimicrobiota bacterium]